MLILYQVIYYKKQQQKTKKYIKKNMPHINKTVFLFNDFFFSIGFNDKKKISQFYIKSYL